MDKELFDDLILSLNQAVEYSKGDMSKGRSVFLELPEDEIEAHQLFFQRFDRLPSSEKKKAMQYVDELLQANA